MYTELNGELNEWAALQKYAVCEGFKEVKQKQQQKIENINKLKSELDK